MNKKLFTGRNILLAIKALVVILFIFLLFRSYYGIKENYWLANDFEGAFKIGLLTDRMIFKAYILPNLILLLPLIAIFKNNKISWILFNSYFYFLWVNGSFWMTKNELSDTIFLVFLGVFLLAGGIIFLMNLKTIRSDIYKISKNKQIIYNIAATIVGILLTIAVAVIHNFR